MFAVKNNQIVEYHETLDSPSLAHKWILDHQYPLVRTVNHGDFDTAFSNTDTDNGIWLLVYNSFVGSKTLNVKEKFYSVADELDKKFNGRFMFAYLDVSYNPDTPNSLFSLQPSDLPTLLLLFPKVHDC